MGVEEMKAVGIVLGGLAALIVVIGGGLGIAVAIKQLLQKSEPVDPAKEYVTRAELATSMSEMKEEIKYDIDTLRNDVSVFKHDVGSKIDKLGDYQRETAHRQNDITQTMALKLERLLTLREAEAKKRQEEGE